MIGQKWLFFTLSPVEYGETPTVHPVIDLENVDIGFILALTLVAGALFIHFRKDMTLLLLAIILEKLRPLIINIIIFLIFFKLLDPTGAACDGGIGSPPAVGLHPDVPPDTDAPQWEEPVQIPVPPEIPQLIEPLMSDSIRQLELYRRLTLQFLERANDWSDLTELTRILDNQMLIEKRIEAALADDGYNPARILAQRHEIRAILFNNQSGEGALTSRTLARHLAQISIDGTRQSIPYRKVMRGIQNYDIILW